MYEYRKPDVLPIERLKEVTNSLEDLIQLRDQLIVEAKASRETWPVVAAAAGCSRDKVIRIWQREKRNADR